MNDEELWNQLQRGLLKTPPNALGSEEFVSRVMAQLPSSDPVTMGAWWKIPVFVFGSFLMLTLGAKVNDALSAPEPLLLSGSSSAQAQQLLGQSHVEPDDLFTLLTEDTRS